MVKLIIGTMNWIEILLQTAIITLFFIGGLWIGYKKNK